MFCPKCSQQQISDETRFCSRCGFQLGAVKALLAAGDAPGEQAATSLAPDRSLRKRDVTLGSTLMFLAALLVATLTVSMPPAHSARIIFLIIAWLALALLINIVPLIRYFFNGDASSAASGASASELARGLMTHVSPAARNSALPPAHSVPVANTDWSRAKTAEVVQPPSVAEPTTNLLNNK
jgi:hypothetical protein